MFGDRGPIRPSTGELTLELELRLDMGAWPEIEERVEAGPWLEIEERLLDVGRGMRLGGAAKAGEETRSRKGGSSISVAKLGGGRFLGVGSGRRFTSGGTSAVPGDRAVSSVRFHCCN